MPTTRTWKRIAAALVLAFAALNTANALNKGGDAAVFFEGGRRVLEGTPLYEGSSAADGFIGPPFQALFFAPFSAIASASGTAARLVWHAFNVACLCTGVWCAWAAWSKARDRMGLKPRPMFPTLLPPLVAILLPVQTNFEHQNMNAVLLALLAAATWQLTIGSAILAGVLIGVATALKAFPALLILWLLARRLWTALASAVATAVVLTVLPAVVYGPAGLHDLLRTFWRLGNSGWPSRGNNQSLVAAIDRFTSGLAIGDGVRVAADAPQTVLLYVVCALALVLMLAAVLVTTRHTSASISSEIAAVTTLAILLSPIAWDHYWTLLFPAFLILYDSQDPRLLGRAGGYAFWTAALLTTALSPVTLGAYGFNRAREMSVDTCAGLIVYAAMLMLCRRIGRPMS
jgi:Glycosyltransferase family 87